MRILLESSNILHTAKALSLRGNLWLTLLLGLPYLVPQYWFSLLCSRRWETFPGLTYLVLDSSAWLKSHLAFLPCLLLPLLAIDGSISLLLRQGERLRWLGRIWTILMWFLPLAALGVFLFALTEPSLKIRVP